MRVIVVDDEPKAIELIVSYLSYFSSVEIVSTFRNALKALEFLNSNSIDVVFLDISMPHLNGLSLSKMITADTSIVFTTAYSEHALESYDVNAFDYLLKPISLERFSKTIVKLTEKFDKQIFIKPTLVEGNERIFIKSGLDKYQVKLNEITFLEKDGNYIDYHVNGKKIIARQSIPEALEILPENFIQVQKSFIINFSKIDSISSNTLQIGDFTIPIGAQFKGLILNKLK